MIETLVIAGDFRTAASLADFYMLREVRPDEIDRRGGYRAVLKKLYAYEWSPAHLAVRSMQGRRYDRIIIGGDWMRGPYNMWHLPVGGWTELWYTLEIQRMRGAQRVWA